MSKPERYRQFILVTKELGLMDHISKRKLSSPKKFFPVDATIKEIHKWSLSYDKDHHPLKIDTKLIYEFDAENYEASLRKIPFIGDAKHINTSLIKKWMKQYEQHKNIKRVYHET